MCLDFLEWAKEIGIYFERGAKMQARNAIFNYFADSYWIIEMVGSR